MPESIVLLTEKDLGALIEHFIASAAQNGADGDPINSPYDKSYIFPAEAAKEQRRNGWAKAPSTPGWKRSWALSTGTRFVGHVELHGHSLASGLHRCTLGLAVEREYRRRGHARALMGVALSWARATKNLEWMDLGGFAANLPAIALYRELGFTEVGRVSDKFRVNGASVDDVSMTLKLRA